MINTHFGNQFYSFQLTYVSSSVLTEMLNCDKKEIDAVKLVDAFNAQVCQCLVYENRF